MLEALFPWPAVVPAAVAAAVSLFLFVKTLVGGRLPGCGPGSACDSFTTSRWARSWQVPVALPATLLYLSIVVLLLMNHHGLTPPAHSRNVLTGLSVLAIGGATWFVLIQAFVLRRFCVWCIIDHAAGIAAAAIVLGAFWPQFRSDPALPLAIALAPLAVLVLGQLLIEPRTYEVQKPTDMPRVEAATHSRAATIEPKPAPPAPTPVPTPAFASPPSYPHATDTPPTTAAHAPALAPAAPPAPSRDVALLEGRLKIQTAAFPLFGPPDAPHVIADMLDYTCEHCRELHHWLTQSRAHFKDKLAVVAIPLPMESACNPMIQFTNPKHVNACAYTRYALAVWHADRAKFHEYHEWLYAPPRPPRLDDARARAEQLVDPPAFAAALASPAVETQIKNAIGIYRFLGAGQIPKLVMNRGVLVGQVPSLQRLIQILEADFRPTTPPPPPAPPQDQITTTFIGGFR